ncbi:hypothetical protein EDF74_1266 [Stenotrophomonas rhizophila]|uniref:hypothetical protein n=1 Tax=Stenotrophomonas rhizophila TaxID=216778 RepID=UPI000F4BC39D|nr:hypothetical protein [Stenotrophomonas rhizophila]ROP80197.1 hypothetical protein EDF74_1266 [Stenotrophomonas rhizophila]
MQNEIRIKAGLAAVGLTMLLCACSPQGQGDAAPIVSPSGADPGAAKAADPGPASTTAGHPSPVYQEGGSGIAVGPVAGVRVVHDFQREYLASPSWKLFASPDSMGTPLVALVLEGSDRVTAGELRIGRSEDAAAVNACLELPAEATGPTAATTVDIGGVPFTHFTVGDAAMSHYVNAESYRAVRDGSCYAIDLVVAGTRPEVYDPPKVPPFTQADAASRLAEALKAVYWVR